MARLSTGPSVRSVTPGSTSYLLHEMREVEIDAAVLGELVSALAPTNAEPGPPTLERVCTILRDADARLFVPNENRGC